MNARVYTRAFVFSRPIEILTAGVVLLAACDSHEAKNEQAQAEAAARTATATETAEAGGEVVDSTAVIQAQAWITDANALALVGVMNGRQLSAANVELDAWHSDTVKQFALLVAHEHAAAQRSADSLAQRLRIVPVMSALNLRIDSAFRARVDSLRGLSSTALERGFAHQQVMAEQDIASYADQLTGAVRAPEVRALMESTANQARARLARARLFDASLTRADSVKKAAIADSLDRVAKRRAARDSARAARDSVRAARRQKIPPAQ
jgi:hypothetical protein